MRPSPGSEVYEYRRAVFDLYLPLQPIDDDPNEVQKGWSSTRRRRLTLETFINGDIRDDKVCVYRQSPCHSVIAGHIMGEGCTGRGVGEVGGMTDSLAI